MVNQNTFLFQNGVRYCIRTTDQVYADALADAAIPHWNLLARLQEAAELYSEEENERRGMQGMYKAFLSETEDDGKLMQRVAQR
jgi:hypothetical protein